MKIAIDAMGGDFAPQVVIEGALLAAKEYPYEIILVGDSARIKNGIQALAPNNGFPISIKQASQIIHMEDTPLSVFRKKEDSSINVSLSLLKEGKVDAVVSAGNSGGVLLGSLHILSKLEGVERPAIATFIPTIKGRAILLDAGGNINCKPHHLVQFAVMGTVFSKIALGNSNPTVGLLSNGKENFKGNDLIKEGNMLLSRSSLNYVGFVEGKEIFSGDVDIIVCDGFLGNVVLKVSEGLAETLLQMIGEEIKKGYLTRLGYLFVKKALRQVKNRTDYTKYGGAPLLGIDGIVIIGHGKSTPSAIKNAIGMAGDLARKKILKRFLEELKKNQDLCTVGKRHFGFWRKFNR